MINVNDTADRNIKPLKGIYLMTDVYGNQRKVKVVPAEKSMKIELLESAPKLKTSKEYDDFLYKKGSVRLKYADCYVWDKQNFKAYCGEYVLYFEKDEGNII